jgi:uncharacterized protein
VKRLVVAGPVGTGKTTFVKTISETDVIDTDRSATDPLPNRPAKTTTAFDFGRINVGADLALQLYGMPGQKQFEFMWEMLIADAHAYILLVAAHRPHELREARRMINFMDRRKQIPMLIGVTHCDAAEAWSLENIAIGLGLDGVSGGVSESDGALANNIDMIAVDTRDLASTAHAIMLIAQAL